MNIRKLLGIPTTEKLAEVVAAAVIKELDDQVIGPILNRLDKRVDSAQSNIINAIGGSADNIKNVVLHETAKIKDAAVASADMIKDQATAKVSKKMESGYKRVLGIFK
tara:strand:- start:13258 stop:13581 length:324 start_codon:yes stop_codon:yes gene_type:complete